MRARVPTFFCRACLLATVAGTGLSSAAFALQPDGTDRARPASAADRAHRTDHSPMFLLGQKLKGKSVYSSRDENLGSVEDMIIDRGSGQIAYLILKTGTTLGMGGKLIAAPYSSFGWDQMEKHVLLNSSPDEVKAWPEFQKDKWMAAGEDRSSLSRTLANQYYKPTSDQPAYPADKNLEDARVKGRISQITRKPGAGTPEEIVITVTTDDNQTKQVVVGPSWYMAGNSITFYRDAPIDMRVIRVDQGGRQTLLARSVSMNSKDVPLYDDRGVPTWSGTRITDSRRTDMVSTPFVLSTDIVGKQIECRGEKCGKVSDLIIEVVSGQVAFLSVDPDQNILGIGDTKRMVPWTVVMAVGADKVMLDASKSMIVNAQQLPSDFRSFGTDGSYKNVYQAYDVQAPTFTPARDSRQ